MATTVESASYTDIRTRRVNAENAIEYAHRDLASIPHEVGGVVDFEPLSVVGAVFAGVAGG